MKIIAVMAHYDVDNIVDPYLDVILDKITTVAEKVILVSTSDIDTEVARKYPGLQIIVRENVGYDFCSYKEGILSIEDLYIYDQLLVLNDSFYCSKDFDLQAILNASEAYDIYSLTASRQFAYHLQSYFLIFNKKAFTSFWFYNFWNNLFQYKRKEKIIFDYEIELTNSALRSGLSTGCYYLAQHDQNPCHHDYRHLYDTYGFVKTDVLRNDIGELNFSNLDNSAVLENHLLRTKASYKNRLFKYSPGNFITAGNNFFEYIGSGEKTTKIAIILHLYYVDLAGEFYERFSLLPIDFDLFITIPDEKYIPLVRSYFRGIANNIFIAVVENKGRDVLPFIKTMLAYDFNQYEMVLKLHSKKSKYSHLGSKWRQEIICNLIPSGPIILKLLDCFMHNKIGIAADKRDYLSNEEYWGCNQHRVYNAMESLGVSPQNKQLFFVGGTMFWFKPAAVYPLVNLLASEEFESESGQQDGTLAHVFERTTCVPVMVRGFKCIDIKTLSEIDITKTCNNKVLVL